MYEIQLFGQLEVRTRGVRLTGRDFGGTKPRHVLALLALHGPLHKTDLTELLWNGNPPANHAATLESHVSILRHRLDPHGSTRHSIIATGNGGYGLVADSVRVDVARFDELVAAAAGRTADRALPPLTAASHVAAHPLLSDEHAEWATAAREQYRARLLETLLAAGDHALATDRPHTALALSTRAVELQPTAERGWLSVMAAHRALGDRAAALRAYDRCRRELADGLGVQPSTGVRQLFLELLREDGAGATVDGAVAAVLAAARDLDRPGTVTALLRRAADLSV